jgi:hypothetical protein
MRTVQYALCLWSLLFVVSCSGQPVKEPDIIETATAVKVHAEYKTLLSRCRKLAKTYEVYDACADAVDANFCQHHGLRCVDAGAP